MYKEGDIRGKGMLVTYRDIYEIRKYMKDMKMPSYCQGRELQIQKGWKLKEILWYLIRIEGRFMNYRPVKEWT